MTTQTNDATQYLQGILDQPQAATLRTAVIVVDVQQDFCEGGALTVPNAADIFKPINQLMERFPTVATKDWHYANDPSFIDNGGQWPAHCVVGTSGARFHPDLGRRFASIFFKTGYSGFDGKDYAAMTLEAWLRENEVDRVIVCGLAMDYCVKETALDAKRLGFEVVVPLDATRPVDPAIFDILAKQLREAGIVTVPRAEQIEA